MPHVGGICVNVIYTDVRLLLPKTNINRAYHVEKRGKGAKHTQIHTLTHCGMYLKKIPGPLYTDNMRPEYDFEVCFFFICYHCDLVRKHSAIDDFYLVFQLSQLYISLLVNLFFINLFLFLFHKCIPKVYKRRLVQEGIHIKFYYENIKKIRDQIRHLKTWSDFWCKVTHAQIKKVLL